MPGLTINSSGGSLTIDGVLLNTPAWDVLDLYRLWGYPGARGEQGGSNLVLPDEEGQLPYAPRTDQGVFVMTLHVIGEVDRTGAPYPTALRGLLANIDYLWEQLGVQPDNEEGTRTAVLVEPDGSTRTDSVQVSLRLGNVEGGTDTDIALVVTVPSGRFGAVPSS